MAEEYDGFSRDVLEEMLRRICPDRHAQTEGWPEEAKEELYRRLGAAYGAALDRAILWGTRQQRQEATRAGVRAQITAANEAARCSREQEGE